MRQAVEKRVKKNLEKIVARFLGGSRNAVYQAAVPPISNHGFPERTTRMTEVMLTIDSPQQFEEVVKVVEDALTQIWSGIDHEKRGDHDQSQSEIHGLPLKCQRDRGIDSP